MNIHKFVDTKRVIDGLLERKIPFETALEMAALKMKLIDDEKEKMRKAYAIYVIHKEKSRMQADPEKTTDPYRQRMTTKA